MLFSTSAVVLHRVNVSDGFAIVRVLTESLGLVSCWVPRGRSRSGGVSGALFFPLSVVELVLEQRAGRDVLRVREARAAMVLSSVREVPVKGMMCVFLAEWLGMVLAERVVDGPLFGFVVDSVGVLELLEGGVANFHLAFLIGLSRFLGFFPEGEVYGEGMCFDLQNGVFVSGKPGPGAWLGPAESGVLALLLRMNYRNMRAFSFVRQERREIVYRLLDYYRLHLNRWSEIRSLGVLGELFG